ncbi:MAG: helix-turn-helix domain-containing protein [bacterium]
MRSRNTAQKVALRARIVLGASEEQSNAHLARQLGITRPTVLLWRTRYAQAGLAGLLKDAAGSPQAHRRPEGGRHRECHAAYHSSGCDAPE